MQIRSRVLASANSAERVTPLASHDRGMSSDVRCGRGAVLQERAAGSSDRDSPRAISLHDNEDYGDTTDPHSVRLGRRHGHATMVAQHLGRHLTNEQRKRWVTLLLDTADDLKLPDDPEFRSALVGYLEWGSRLAVLNSATTDNPIVQHASMPQWGWGEVKGPYSPG
jgi:hypothetical protein